MPLNLKNKVKGDYALYLVLLLIVLFHFINNFIILKADDIPFTGHNAANYASTLYSYENIKNPLGVYHSYRYYPPFFMLLPLPFLWLFGKNIFVAIMSNMVYFFILIFSTYGIGKHICNRKAGLLVAFITSMSPAVYGFSRMYWPDFPIASIVTLSIFLLLKTDSFNNRGYSILFGVSTGIGMMTRWNFLIYIISPLIALTLFRNSEKKVGTKNLLAAGLISFIIIAPWYFRNMFPVLKTVIPGQMTFIDAPSYLGRVLRSLEYFYYAQHGWFYPAIFILSFFLFLCLKKYHYRIFIVSWIVGTLLLVSILRFQTPRYILPIIPAAALLMSIPLFKIRVKRFRRASYYTRFVLIFLIITAGFAQFFHLCYGVKPKGFFTVQDMGSREEITGLLHPEKIRWGNELEDLIKVMGDYSKDKSPLMLTTNTDWPIFGQLLWEINMRKLPIRFDNVLACFFGTSGTCSPEGYEESISNATFLIAQECYEGNMNCKVINIHQNIDDYNSFWKIFESQKNEFHVLKRIDLGDNSTTVVYYRVKEHI